MRGESRAPREEQVAGLVYRLNIPVSLNECSEWWAEATQMAEDVGCKISYRAMRFARKGPGWYTLTALGAGGEVRLEEVVKSLLTWVPHLDVHATRVPTLSTVFPVQAVVDILGNAQEWKLPAPFGVTLTDAGSMSIVVAGSSPQVQIWQLKKGPRRRRAHHRRSIAAPGGVTPVLTSVQPRRSPSPEPRHASPPRPEAAAAEPVVARASRRSPSPEPAPALVPHPEAAAAQPVVAGGFSSTRPVAVARKWFQCQRRRDRWWA